MPESQTNGRWSTWIQARQVFTTEDPDHTRWMPECRHLSEEARLDSLALREVGHWPLSVHQQLDGLDPGRVRRLDEIFALTNEQAEPLTLAARRESADKAKPGVGRRGDHGPSPSHSSHCPWKGACARSSSSSSGQRRAQRPQ